MTNFAELIYEASENFLFIPFLAFFLGSVILSFKTRFVQVRYMAYMFKILFQSFFKTKTKSQSKYTIQSHKALFTAMATSIGIGNIVAPVIAIGFGGPGALVGFLFAMFFGSAATFVEVTLAVKHRKEMDNGRILGGPMQYIKDHINSVLAIVYSSLAFILIAVWESNQSNTLACLLEPYNIPSYFSGFLMSVVVVFALFGGIRRVGNITEKLVPAMFFLYSISGLIIIFLNADKLPEVISLIFSSAFSFDSLKGTLLGVGTFKALRWGLAEGFYSNEAGVGVAPIPHSMTKTSDPFEQGILSMVSVYSNGLLCMISGLLVLVTGVYSEPGAIFDINMIVKVFSNYFPGIGAIILSIAAILFSFTTILGNGYNGGQCFLYVTKNRWMPWYYGLIGAIIFFGAIADVKMVWAATDFFMIPVALINIISIIYISFKTDLIN